MSSSTQHRSSFSERFDDLCLPLSNGNAFVPALLDFSSTFLSTYHSTHLHLLHTDDGFTDTAHQWFSSYLTERTHLDLLSNFILLLTLYILVFLMVQSLAKYLSQCTLTLFLLLLFQLYHAPLYC